MNHIRVQARLALGALIAAVLTLTLVPGTTSAAPADSAKPSTAIKTERAGTKALAPTAAPANARRDCYLPNCYGAIAMNKKTLKTFGGWNYGSRYLAERSQYKRCTRNTTFDKYCAKIVWVRNGCAAVGYKPRPAGGYWYAWASGYRNQHAVKRAVRKKLNFGEARVLQWICTSRRY